MLGCLRLHGLGGSEFSETGCFMFRRVHLSVESFSRSLFVIPGEGVKDATLGEILLVCMLSFRS